MPLLPCNIWCFRGFTIQHFVSVAFAFRINRTKTDAMSYKIVCECHNMVRVCSVDFRDSTLFRKTTLAVDDTRKIRVCASEGLFL